MKYTRLPLLLSFFVCFFSGTTHTAILEQASIEKKAAAIKKKMTQDRYFFYGLTALGIVYQLSHSFVELKKAFSTNFAKETTVQAEKIPMIQAFKAALQHLAYTQEGWVTTAQVFIGIGSSIFVSKMCEKLIHPDTLRWYINTHASYHLTIKIIKEHLSELQDQSIDSERAQICDEMVSLLYNRLIRQSESVCAYVTYKLTYLEDEEKALAERAKRFMISSQNGWLNRLSALLSADRRDYNAIYALFVAYEADIAQQIAHFSIIEGETLSERSIVKKQIKQSLGEF